jgi:uridine phosphorylase
MVIKKCDYPILEYDTTQKAIFMPNRNKSNKFPKYCVMTFFNEIIEEMARNKNNKITKIAEFKSEIKKIPVYKIIYKKINICLVQAPVGASLAAVMTDYLIAGGVKYIIAGGACGVLEEIPPGNVMVPIKAIRDEGASYHYLPPEREIKINKNAIKYIKKTLNQLNINYIECKTWTTDGLYRETKKMVEYRKQEGCKVVEMECSAMAAVSKFRKIIFGQLLYSGDLVITRKYNDREWFNNTNARGKLFYISLEIIKELHNEYK